MKLFDTILEQGGTVIKCEDLRDERIVVKTAPSFLMAAEGADMTLRF